MATCLALIAHGSKQARWRQTFDRIREEIASKVGSENVYLCYMEITEPTLRTVVRSAHSAGFTDIKVLPIFMAGGGHVDHDIPGQIKEVEADYPDLTFSSLPAIGEHPKMLHCMVEIAEGYLDK